MALKSVQAVINGTTYTLTLNESTGKYEATVTAPSSSSYNMTGHYYPVTIKAEDMAGNTAQVDPTHATLGDSLKLRVKETVPPQISIVSPTDGSTITSNTPDIVFTVYDFDSGLNPDSISFQIDGEIVDNSHMQVETINGETANKRVTFSDYGTLSDGPHNFSIWLKDYDDNVATKSWSCVVDTTAPSLTITAPENGIWTNSSIISVVGVTNDDSGSNVTVTIELNGNETYNVTLGSDGSFSKQITLDNGENTIVVKSTDGSGKSTTVTRTVYVDKSAPVIKSITITPNPVNTGTVFTISVDVEDA